LESAWRFTAAGGPRISPLSFPSWRRAPIQSNWFVASRKKESSSTSARADCASARIFTIATRKSIDSSICCKRRGCISVGFTKKELTPESQRTPRRKKKCFISASSVTLWLLISESGCNSGQSVSKGKPMANVSSQPPKWRGQDSAVYTGVFDPFHLGHLDIVKRGSRLYDRLVVGVGTNPEKKP